MKRTISTIIWSGIFSFIFCSIVALFLYLLIGGEYDKQIGFLDNISQVFIKHKIDVLFYGYFGASMLCFFQLIRLLNTQLNNPLLFVFSDMIKKQAHTFSEEDVTKICKKINALEEGTHVFCGNLTNLLISIILK